MSPGAIPEIERPSPALEITLLTPGGTDHSPCHLAQCLVSAPLPVAAHLLFCIASPDLPLLSPPGPLLSFCSSLGDTFYYKNQKEKLGGLRVFFQFQSLLPSDPVSDEPLLPVPGPTRSTQALRWTHTSGRAGVASAPPPPPCEEDP